jgi:hypothetical protein
MNLFNNINELIATGGESIKMPRTIFLGTEGSLQIEKIYGIILMSLAKPSLLK